MLKMKAIKVQMSLACFYLISAYFAMAAPAANVKTTIDRAETPNNVKEKLILPYLFSTDSMGLNLGGGGMLSGYFQDQMTIGGTVFGGEVSQGAGLGVWNFKLPKTERFFLSAVGFLGY
mgnify:CR=1 FL=1